MDAIELSGEGSSYVHIFGVECFFKCLFGVSKRLGFAFIGLDIGCEVVQFLLNALSGTSTAASLFLSDIDAYIIRLSILTLTSFIIQSRN